VIPLKDNVPTRSFPYVTIGLIVANALVRLWELSSPGVDVHVARDGYYPCLVNDTCNAFARRFHDLPWYGGAFSSMFMHASWQHIGGNMLFLWIFGNNVEDAMGPVKYLLFYIAGGLAAMALQVAIGPNSAVPTLGASGAIAAVLAGYIVLYPRARVLTLVIIIFFFTVIELPAWVMLGIWFVQQAVFAATNLTTPAGGGGGVAYFAHIGGFVFGLLAVRLLATKRKQVPGRYPVY
jgi:membrane associated rhomboid family serine protease